LPCFHGFASLDTMYVYLSGRLLSHRVFPRFLTVSSRWRRRLFFPQDVLFPLHSFLTIVGCVLARIFWLDEALYFGVAGLLILFCAKWITWSQSPLEYFKESFFLLLSLSVRPARLHPPFSRPDFFPTPKTPLQTSDAIWRPRPFGLLLLCFPPWKKR